MAESMSTAELMAKVAAIAAAHEVKAAVGDGRSLTGTQEAIKSKWFLGGRKVVYRMRCEFDEPGRAVRFREAAVEASWGVPPPTLTVEKTTQHGTRVTKSRTDRSTSGGGHLDYGGLREKVEEAVQTGGWKFVFEPGRLP
jgi:hypothetical protein